VVRQRSEPERRSFESGDGVPMAGMQEGDGKVARKLLRVDVVLVVSLLRAKKGRSVGTTVSPSGGSGEDRRRSVLGGVSARGWRKVGLEVLVGQGGARGALGCRRGAAEVAIGGKQDGGGALVTVDERRRKRGGEMRPCEEGKEVEEGSWTRCKTKRSHGRAGSSCWRPAAQRGGFGRRRCNVAGLGKRQQGRASGGRASWRLGGAGRAARGQLAAREITGQ
jgi:hypothetical protein